jgi:hypothetical protein
MRENAIKSYLADQYRIDNEVKFKQINLQNKLIDLYTDVPLSVKEFNQKDEHLKRILESVYILNKRIFEDDFFFRKKEENIGTANFLLNSKVQNGIERILLEGGPGQGKSTISQYICQVHRAKFLDKEDDLKLLPDNFRGCPIRIPFKIDLRHVALWVQNKNPYMGSLSDETFNKIWQKKLESFITGNIIYHSSINEFNTSDLIAITNNSSVLFVFDGFDEIADMKIRQEVIDFIDNGINRIRAISKSLQVLITSRPAAFSNTIGFPIDAYPHFELADITPSCTKEYMEKWIKANNLDDREGNEIRRLVEEKLQIPHLRELAKSPMQLAIFISLLRTRGESLPNKRTALYDSYIDLFFNREAEKSQVIRDNRDLIIDIHKYLAWVLHYEAELYNNNGCITIEHLIEKLKKYLEKEEHATGIAELFQVVEERVCALVSRVQGTYEFEVQPLREYFCAKYLYETAPYSPAGNEKKGTKPERFNAIARDFYWNNVVRFYSGCFDKGELPMLLEELKELQKDDLLKYTNYPQLLISQLLSDYVFTQYPKHLKDVIKIILDDLSIGNIINQSGLFHGGNEPILLPNECGRIEMTKECFEQLKYFPHNDYATELIGLIVNNPCEEVLNLWKNELQNLTIEQTLQWLEYAYRMQIVHKIEENILIDLVLQDTDLSVQERKVQIIIDGNRFDVVNYNIQLKQIALRGIMSGKILLLPYNKKYDFNLQLLFILLNPFVINAVIYESKGMNKKFIEYINDRFIFCENEKYNDISNTEIYQDDDIDNSIRKLYDSIKESLNTDLSNWKNNLKEWDFLIEKFSCIFGDNWIFKILATMIVGINDINLPNEEYRSLSDTSISLCKRAKYAYIKKDNLDYWKHQFNRPPDLFTCLMFFTWTTPNVIIKLHDKIQLFIKQFSETDIKVLFDGLNLTTSIVQNKSLKKQWKEMIISEQFESLSLETKCLISCRFPNGILETFICNQINEISGILKIDLIETKFKFLISKYLKDVENKSLLDEIKKYYPLIYTYDIDDRYTYRRYFFFHDNIKFANIPVAIAMEIMKDSKAYPRIIVSMAEKSCRLEANRKVKFVGQIAKEEKWFD